MRHSHAVLAVAALSLPTPSQAQSFQPRTFSIDGIAVRCGNVPIILDTSIPHVGQAGYGLIYLNPDYSRG